MSNRSLTSTPGLCKTVDPAGDRRAGATKPFLYISYFFPPHGGPESRHNLSMIRALGEHGFCPTVLTAPENVEYPKDRALCALIPDGMEIRRFFRPRQTNAYLVKARQALGIPRNPLEFEGAKEIYRAARSVLNEHPAEFIYSVHGIGAAHLAALRLKERTGLPWVAEFSDPLIHNSIIWAYMKDHSWRWWMAHQRRRTRALQREMLAAADLVVVESPRHAELLVSDFGLPENRVVSYGLGYGEEYFAEPGSPLVRFTNRPVIGFIGSIYYGYDDALQDLLTALKELEDQGETFTFVSVGSSSAAFAGWARAIGLKNFLSIERVGLDQALALMASLDLGLVCVSADYATNINSKIWEYLRANVSILALVPDPGAMADLVRDGRCGYLLPYDSAGMVQVLRGVLEDHRTGRLPRARPEFVAQFSRARLAAKLALRIGAILSPAQTIKTQ